MNTTATVLALLLQFCTIHSGSMFDASNAQIHYDQCVHRGIAVSMDNGDLNIDKTIGFIEGSISK